MLFKSLSLCVCVCVSLTQLSPWWWSEGVRCKSGECTSLSTTLCLEPVTPKRSRFGDSGRDQDAGELGCPAREAF
ncbi:hypothetical protein L211DRAFT_839454 [Terfezia boudieri ATCC MYA-4762]|uniref:Secreted protein n=1 Tax=Terfezia boudieri ATCC MYA-4762 TaxID=1051890 RepID=A0A3N4LLW0_9PEZI|nr:hypothetical protein L211DRAFT_839454 [Terfezia boudieri ATCC MYA-4762]